MSSRHTKQQALSDNEIRQISAEIAAGNPPMVWFTADAVGVPEGRSGKVVAVGDPAEGDYLHVRPTGSKDVLSFAPTEVTREKPMRRPVTAIGAHASEPRKETVVTKPHSAHRMPAPAHPPAERPAPAAQPAASAAASNPTEAHPATPRATRAKAGATRRSKAAEITVMLSGTADGDWTVDVVGARRRTLRGLPVAGSAVAQAAKLLHPEVAEVVESVLESVRTAQRARVEELQAQLDQARRTLDELTD